MGITHEQLNKPPKHDWITGNLIRDIEWLKWFHQMGDLHNNIEFVNIIGDLDDITDGTSYAKVLKTSISAGKILLSECTGTLDNIADGTNYSRVKTLYLTAGQIKLDDVLEGTYGLVKATEITAGKISLLAGYPAGQIADQAAGVIFQETFENPENDLATRWENSGPGDDPYVTVGSAQAEFGGNIGVWGNNSGNDYVLASYYKSIPFSIDKTYKVSCKIWRNLGTGTAITELRGLNGCTFDCRSLFRIQP